jgi:protein-disulfide isomerase
MPLCRKSVISGALGGLTASVLVWTSLHFLNSSFERKQKVPERAGSVSLSEPFFDYKGQPVAAQLLSKELKEQFERAAAVSEQIQRDAQLQFFKEADKIARLHVLEKELAVRSATQQKSLEEVESDLLPREEATNDDARRLYEASDPSAPREGFAPVKKQLIGYLNEVRRRQALEVWSNDLRKKGEWAMRLERPQPLPDLASLNFTGLPRDNKTAQPNVVVFVDYLCSECVPFLVEFSKRLGEHRTELNPVYVPFPYTDPDVSMSLARASLCSQQLGNYSSFHMAALTKADLISEVSVFDLARQAGLPVGEFKDCYRSGEGLAELLGRAQQLARQFGLMQTPALVYRGHLLEGSEIFPKFEELLKTAGSSEQLTKRSGENRR